ncbi:uncharacterized protein LOC125669161 [Ostrea edulis]|uniref:uncharacterized protein LOC125669161 n=1 Tax=Ostrea edulis TaxID=37623 RepID=UPI0024AF8FB3|nr:uncharacterized protein LOC125669161 [Ostrea edulis]
MLKKWIERQDDNVVMSAVYQAETSDEDWIGNPLMHTRDTVKDVNISRKLNPEQTCELWEVLEQFDSILTHVPGRTNMLKHKLITTSETSIHQRPYQIPHSLRDEVRKELDAMLEAGVVEQSDAGLTINPKKCEFGAREMEFLGHIVGRGQVKPTSDKVKAVLDIPAQTKKKEMQATEGWGRYCYKRKVVSIIRWYISVKSFFLDNSTLPQWRKSKYCVVSTASAKVSVS